MTSWGNYWQENPKLFTTVMEKSTEYVARKLTHNQLIGANSQVLDFGCGPGYLANALKGSIASYFGIDISQHYIEMAKEKCKDYPNFRFKAFPLDQSIYSLSILEQEGNQFDTIVILSVVQYFEKKEDVLQLLEKCKLLLKPRGKIILADVITNEQGLLKDIISILAHSIKNKYFFQFLKFMFVAKQSKYNQLRKNKKLLTLSKSEILSYANQLQLELDVLPTITMQSSRVSYCLVS
jgi:2-polyprenyl-3-methyl-5-hydroxy-6-metoxy-1,4-benzoquinol methylase